MLAYVFWHRPREGVEALEYEAALREFHGRLAEEAVEGVHGSAAFAVDRLPWLGGGQAYEDWYLLEAGFALDTLNGAAVSGRMTRPHRRIAALTGPMAAGLYRLVRGDGCRGSQATWSQERPSAAGALWQRQMVLGPTPEFCLLGGGRRRPAPGRVLVSRRPVAPGP